MLNSDDFRPQFVLWACKHIPFGVLRHNITRCNIKGRVQVLGIFWKVLNLVFPQSAHCSGTEPWLALATTHAQTYKFQSLQFLCLGKVWALCSYHLVLVLCDSEHYWFHRKSFSMGRCLFVLWLVDQWSARLNPRFRLLDVDHPTYLPQNSMNRMLLSFFKTQTKYWNLLPMMQWNPRGQEAP